MSTVCLAMIVKNEAHVIRRALDSVRPLITHWAICDTGSSDATREVVREAMGDLPGVLVDRPWVDAATNRNESLALARAQAEYALVLDADDRFEFPDGARLPPLTEPAYAVRVFDGEMTYARVHLTGREGNWRFAGPKHEAMVSDDGGIEKAALLEGIVYRRLPGGGRHADLGRYAEDAALLEELLRKDPGNARDVFYLARSYEDAGVFPRALANYERRRLMGGWDEEVYEAAYGAARVRACLGRPLAEIVTALREAAATRPSRAEPLIELARIARAQGDLTSALAYARAAVALPMSTDRLFVYFQVYRWRALDELAVVATACGAHDEAREAYARLAPLLETGEIPEPERARIEAGIAASQRLP